MSPNTHLALLALLLGSAQQTDAHRYHRHHHHGRRLFKPSPTFVNNEMAGPFRPFHTYPSGAGGGIFTSAGPLVDVFQEVLGDIKKATRHFSDSTTATMRTPPHEVAETAEAAIITADLPGCKREDVDAQISEEGGSKTLTITAVRKKPVLAANGNPEPSPSTDASDLAESAASPSETAPAATATAAASPSGLVDASEKETSSAESCSSSPSPSFTEERFKLSFSVGDGIDTSAIRGSLEDGVLTLVLPKLAPEPPAEPIDIPIDFAAGNVNTNSNDKGAGAGSVAGSGRSGVETGSAADGETHISLA